VSRVYPPPGWAKFWWFADRIQYDNQRELEKKAPPILFGKIHAPTDSFISKNEGMNQVITSNGEGDQSVESLVVKVPLPPTGRNGLEAK
jgi:hypothetical protein